MRAAAVHVSGELDLCTSPQLERALRAAQLQARLVVLDTREVSFIDGSAVHAILDANAGADRCVPRLIVVPSQAVERVLKLVGVHEQIWTIDLDPSEPDRGLDLVPEVLGRMSAERANGESADRQSSASIEDRGTPLRRPKVRSPQSLPASRAVVHLLRD